MTQDAAAIADRLSKAQRAVLLEHQPGYYFGSQHGGWSAPARSPVSWSQVGRAMLGMNLIKWHPSIRDSRTHITPLGLAVRAHLQAMNEVGPAPAEQED